MKTTKMVGSSLVGDKPEEGGSEWGGNKWGGGLTGGGRIRPGEEDKLLSGQQEGELGAVVGEIFFFTQGASSWTHLIAVAELSSCLEPSSLEEVINHIPCSQWVDPDFLQCIVQTQILACWAFNNWKQLVTERRYNEIRHSRQAPATVPQVVVKTFIPPHEELPSPVGQIGGVLSQSEQGSCDSRA